MVLFFIQFTSDNRKESKKWENKLINFANAWVKFSLCSPKIFLKKSKLELCLKCYYAFIVTIPSPVTQGRFMSQEATVNWYSLKSDNKVEFISFFFHAFLSDPPTWLSCHHTKIFIISSDNQVSLPKSLAETFLCSSYHHEHLKDMSGTQR
jgi:hypothetical protein